MDRFAAGVALTPIAGLVGSLVGSTLIVLSKPGPSDPSWAALFLIGLIVGSKYAIPTTCLVLPLFHRMGPPRAMLPVIGLLSGVATMAIALAPADGLPLIIAGGAAGAAVGLLYGPLVQRLPRTRSGPPGAARPKRG
jgi:uncharacterized membrane protein YeaQ/YmgE (transglycosylase-associated protein family)